MSEIAAIGALTAFAAGTVSFLSPCVLPLVPAYMSYVTGQSLAPNASAAAAQGSRANAALLSLCFVLGFSAVFITLGASATARSACPFGLVHGDLLLAPDDLAIR